MCQCPHGLVPHFYKSVVIEAESNSLRCQCPHGLIPHCYKKETHCCSKKIEACQCPLGLLPHFYDHDDNLRAYTKTPCQCPLGLLPHFYTSATVSPIWRERKCVNALSGCYLISTEKFPNATWDNRKVCQCPLGLLPHFYQTRRMFVGIYIYCVNALSGCYLISTQLAS